MSQRWLWGSTEVIAASESFPSVSRDISEGKTFCLQVHLCLLSAEQSSLKPLKSFCAEMTTLVIFSPLPLRCSLTGHSGGVEARLAELWPCSLAENWHNAPYWPVMSMHFSAVINPVCAKSTTWTFPVDAPHSFRHIGWAAACSPHYFSFPSSRRLSFNRWKIHRKSRKMCSRLSL